LIAFYFNNFCYLDNISKGLSDQKCTEGDDVKFEIVFNKEIKPENVVWYKDGIKIEDGDDKGRFKLLNDGKTYTLSIKNATLEDTGVYEIKAGSIKSAASLKVKGNKFRKSYLK
jgi:hypothetical protein